MPHLVRRSFGQMQGASRPFALEKEVAQADPTVLRTSEKVREIDKRNPFERLFLPLAK